MKKSILLSVMAFLLLSVYCIDPGKNKEGTVNDMITAQQLKTASESYLKAWSDNDTTLLQTITIQNMVRNVNGDITSSNRSGLVETMSYWHTAIPDFKVVYREIIVVDNRSFINWSSTGTNTGMFGDTPPTGKKTTTEGFSVLTFDDAGQLIHENAYYNLLGVMTDWGHTVSPPIIE